MRARRLIAVAVLSLGISTAAAASVNASTITLSGSTSIAPLVAKLAKAYVKDHKGTKFAILQGGSDIGINDVAHGRVTLGMSSRDPKPADPHGVVFNKFARDAVCVISNTKNPLPSMSREMIQNIFSGRIRNWAQVPGSKQSGSINLVVRTSASGTADAFQNIFMGEDLKVAQSAKTKPSNGLQAQAIKADPQAIGYASFSYTDGLFNIPYKGVPCTLRNAKSGEYGGVRNFFLVSRGAAKGAARSFLKFAKANKKAQKIIASQWVPLR